MEKLSDCGSNIQCKSLEREPNCIWEGVRQVGEKEEMRLILYRTKNVYWKDSKIKLKEDLKVQVDQKSV